MGDKLAALLHEMASVVDLERRWTTTNLRAQQRHGRGPEHRILHADGHERLTLPLRRPPLPGLT
jgi:hypothetical protein